VILYRFDRQPLEGIVNPDGYLLQERIEMITLDGSIQNPAYTEFKALCFVSESGKADLFTEHKSFERRPKMPGLWTRFLFRDGDQLDGILSHNLLEWPKNGFSIIPPRAGATRQRVFIPRAALTATELRGVVGASGASSRSRKKEGRAQDGDQLTMFER